MAHGRRASVIVVCVGALAVLAVLAVAFVKFTFTERDASANHMAAVRAFLLAEAGIERAMVELPRRARPWNSPRAEWVFGDASGTGVGHGVPIETGAPSFPAGDTADFNPDIRAAGRGSRFSGALPGRIGPGTHEAHGDTYVLKILDTSSMIDLNTPYASVAAAGREEVLVRLLVNLARAIDPSDPPLTLEQARRVVAWRDSLPGRRFAAKTDLLEVPTRPVSPAAFARLADFVTVHGVPDAETIRPLDRTRRPAAGALLANRFAYGPLQVEWRRPVNVNTAPAAVLTALFADLEGTTVVENIPRSPGTPSWTAIGRAERVGIRFATAAGLAARLVAWRQASPLRGVADLETFLKLQVDSGFLSPPQAALAAANADPNPRLNKHNPDRAAWRMVDKLDVLEHTTELCFAARGVFEVQSLGRVTAGGGELVSRAAVSAVIKAYEVERASSQADFAQGTASQFTEIEPAFFRSRFAFLAHQDLDAGGTVDVRGPAGSLHSNGNLTIKGSVKIENDATASGGFSAAGTVGIGGVSGGGHATQPVPVVDPAAYKDRADFVFRSDGTVLGQSGAPVAAGSHRGFSFAKGQWKSTDPTHDGTYFFEGDVEVSGSNSTTWNTTILATGSVSITGSVTMAPSFPGTTIVAGQDVFFAGSSKTATSGLIYAGEQIALAGTAGVRGTLVAGGRGNSSATVTANSLKGTVDLVPDGAGAFIELPGRTLTTATVTLQPEPAAFGPDAVFLPSAARYDGLLRLAVRPSLRSVLGPQPYRDTLLAPFHDSLDADAAGGDPAIRSDASGPLIAARYGVDLPGHLVGDGYYSESGAVGAFAGKGNLAPQRGTIAFWVKLDRDDDSNRSFTLLSLSRADATGKTQAFEVFHAAEGAVPYWGFYYQRSPGGGKHLERLITTTATPASRTWVHIALTWDASPASPLEGIALYLAGKPVPLPSYAAAPIQELTPAELSACDFSAGELRIGDRAGKVYYRTPAAPAATYGDLVLLPVVKDAAWVAAHHQRGRYHPETLTYYTSAARPIPKGSRLLYAAFTPLYPAGWDASGRPIEMEVLDANQVIATLRGVPGAALDHEVSGEVRYRIHLLRSSVPAPLAVTPMVDDVTLAWSVRPQLLWWSASS